MRRNMKHHGAFAHIALMSGAVLAIIGFGTAALAANGNAEALWQRGSALCTRNDCRDAYPFLLQAAKEGNARAQATLGNMYSEGDGVRRDDRAAAHWYSLAAAQGHRAAQYNLGSMYYDGAGGLPQSDAKGLQLYLASARQGFGAAQETLGIAYEFGIGAPRNRATAIYWLQHAAAQGDGRAQWVADWLKRPNTPHFKTLQQLNAYINSQVARYFEGGGSGTFRIGNRSCSNPVACVNMTAQAFGQEDMLGRPTH
jgi:TPR repeat protein